MHHLATLFSLTLFVLFATGEANGEAGHKATSLIPNKDTLAHQAEYYNELGTQYRYESHYDAAIDSYKKALNTNNEELRIEVLNNLGVCYRRQDKLRSATSYHLQALKAIEHYEGKYKKVSFQHRVSLNSIGNIYLTMKQYDKALEYFNQSLALEIEAQNHLGLAINYNNIGSCYQSLGDYTKAEKDYYLSLQENKITHSNLGQAICYNSLGELYLLEKLNKKAMFVLDSALYYSDQLKDIYHRSISHINLSKVYTKDSNYNEAWHHLNILDSLAQIANSRSIYYNLYSNLSDYYEAQKEPNKALYYYKMAVNYNDSIVNETNSNYINDILNVYDNEQKEQKITLLSAQNQIISQQRKLGIIIIIMLMLTFVFFYSLNYLHKKKQLLDYEILHQQLLRSQMNPHFLFNALGSIQNFMLKNETQKAAGYLNNFASLTRSILEHSKKDHILLSDEIDILENYIKLEQMRLQNSFEYTIDYDPSLELDFITLPPMMIQPFVENAIKHGLKNIDYRGQLHLSFSSSDEYLSIIITDNGVGINATRHNNTKHHSMSMEIFEKRRKILLTKEKKGIQFKIEDGRDLNWDHSGTQVYINFPLN